ncbi:MAG: cytochrome c [Rhizobacter sp.]|nr:cytochrome c [Rhizobacter sp.]
MSVRGVTAAALLVCSAVASAQTLGAPEREAARKLFTNGAAPACAICHTLRDAGAAGEVGPVLDELQPDEARVAKAVQDGLGVMPPFRDKLSAQDIALLARYVSQVAGPAR